MFRALLHLLLVLLLTTVAACAQDDGTSTAPAEDGRTVVGDVRLVVPDGWDGAQDELPAGVLEAQRWRPAGAELTGLQLVVACGGSLDELVSRVAQTRRHGLEVTNAAEIPGLDVPGLDTTRGLVIDLEGSLAGVDAGELRTAGLYGQRGDALLLLELTQRAEDFDADIAERIFATVEVDEALAARCEAEETT